MESTLPKALLISALAIAVLGIAVGHATTSTAIQKLIADFPEFTGEPPETKQGELKNVDTFEAEQAKNHLRITVTQEVEPEAARKMLKSETLQVQSAFRKDRQPYHDMITQNRECKSSYSPKVIETSDANSFAVEVATNNRLSYGFCDPKQFTHNAIFRNQYCPKSKTYISLKLYRERVLPKDFSKALGDLCAIVEK